MLFLKKTLNIIPQYGALPGGCTFKLHYWESQKWCMGGSCAKRDEVSFSWFKLMELFASLIICICFIIYKVKLIISHILFAFACLSIVYCYFDKYSMKGKSWSHIFSGSTWYRQWNHDPHRQRHCLCQGLRRLFHSRLFIIAPFLRYTNMDSYSNEDNLGSNPVWISVKQFEEFL